MRHASLFSGIGGFDLAAERAGFTNVWQCEKDEWCRKILTKNFPEVKRYDDITTLRNPEPVNVISGGFPCQPFSVAGMRRGKEDDRYLWPEMLRIISEVRPTWVVGENVAGIVNMELDNVLSDLEREGYEVQAFIIPACGVDAPHRRDRVWIVAHSESKQNWGIFERGIQPNTYAGCSEDVADPTNAGAKDMCGWKNRSADWLPEPGVGRVAHGIPNRVDRLRGLGNAIVPQVAYQIFEAIKEAT